MPIVLEGYLLFNKSCLYYGEKKTVEESFSFLVFLGEMNSTHLFTTFTHSLRRTKRKPLHVGNNSHCEHNVTDKHCIYLGWNVRVRCIKHFSVHCYIFSLSFVIPRFCFISAWIQFVSDFFLWLPSPLSCTLQYTQCTDSRQAPTRPIFLVVCPLYLNYVSELFHSISYFCWIQSLTVF